MVGTQMEAEPREQELGPTPFELVLLQNKLAEVLEQLEEELGPSRSKLEEPRWAEEEARSFARDNDE